MKPIFAAVLASAFALAMAACQPASAPSAPAEPEAPIAVEAASGVYALDKNHASVTVRAMHFGLAYYTLRFTAMDATLTYNSEDPSLSSISASVNIPSIETDYPGPRNFNAELQNSEWLNAAEHPVAEFHSTSVALVGGNRGTITGDLSFNGQTHPISFDVVFNGETHSQRDGVESSKLGFSARGTVRRSQYGLNVLLPPPGSAAGVSDEVELIIEAEFQGPAAPAEAAEPAAAEAPPAPATTE
jgi:polyisoprenoid-binding protein YceI